MCKSLFESVGSEKGLFGLFSEPTLTLRKIDLNCKSIVVAKKSVMSQYNTDNLSCDEFYCFVKSAPSNLNLVRLYFVVLLKLLFVVLTKADL